MQTIDVSYNLIDILQVKKTDFEVLHKQFLILCGTKQFYCGFLIKEILTGLNDKKSFSQIHSQLIQHSAYQHLKLDDVEKIIDKKIRPLGVLVGKENEIIKQKIDYDNDSIKSQKTLFNASKTHFLASAFKFLFQKWVAVFFILSGLFAHVFYLSSHSVFEEQHSVWTEASALEYLLIYLFILLIFVFHEAGHSSAALYFGIRTPRIGYGFYLIYPVFFTQISEAWKLQPQKRIIINLAGVYFQWIAGSIFILLDYFSIASTTMWSGIVAINFVRLLYSFVPFMKADGYWIFSDGFGLTNLREKSNEFLVAIFKYFSFRKARQITDTKTQFYALAFFSFGTVLFFGFWFSVLAIIAWNFAPALPDFLISFYDKWQNATLISHYLKIIVQFILFCITLLGFAIFIVRMIGLIRFAVQFLVKEESSQN